MALAAQPDLATRLKEAQRDLRARLVHRSALADVLRATHSTLDPRTVAAFLVGWAPLWLPLPGWAVVAGAPGHDITLLAQAGVPPANMPAVHAVAARVVATGTDLLTGDVSREDVPDQELAVAVLAFPLIARGRAAGALVGTDTGPSEAAPALEPEVLEAWRGLLEPAALALENALLLQRAEALSVTDDLTRLYNSRYLNESLRRETKRASRTRKPLSLLFVDLDGFKAVNDTYGHLHGSRALVEAAAILSRTARETDVVARFGGDEFAVVLPDTDPHGALAVAARIRERIAEHHFLTADHLDIRLTASVGVATLPDEGGSADELVQSADRAMYRVKAAGKNGVQLSGDRSADI